MLNVLDVPVQANLVAGRNVSSTSVDSIVFTLDPADKYLPPGVRRAATTSAIQKRKARLLSPSKVIHRPTSPPKTSTSSRAGESTLERQRSLMSVFQRMRQTRSAGSNTRSALAWPRKILSRAGKTAKVDSAEDIPDVPQIPIQLPNSPTKRPEENLDLLSQRLTTAYGELDHDAAQIPAPMEAVVVPWPESDTTLGALCPHAVSGPASPRNSGIRVSKAPMSSDHPIIMGQLNIKTSSSTDQTMVAGADSNPGAHALETENTAWLDCENFTKAEIRISKPQKPMAGAVVSQEVEEHQHAMLQGTYAYRDSTAFSYTSGDEYSPYYTSNTTHSGPMSPLHLSQPETPIMSDFGDDVAHVRRESEDIARLTIDFSDQVNLFTSGPPSRAPPPPPRSKPTTSRSVFGNFQKYSLPEDDNVSLLTVREPPSTVFKTPERSAAFPPTGPNQTLVHSWNDGSDYLLDDLDYLSELIN